MGWASERQIEIHNEMMQSDESYREDYERFMFESAMEAEMTAQMEYEENINFFGYRMDYKGYTETWRDSTA